MPITTTEVGPDGTLQTVAEPPAAPSPAESGTPGESAPPAPDDTAAPSPGETAPSESAPEAPESPDTTEDEDEDDASAGMSPKQKSTFARMRREAQAARRLRTDAERKAAAAEAKAQMLEQGYRRPTPEPAPVPLHQQPEPREEDYASQADWFNAVRAWDKAQTLLEFEQRQYQQAVRSQQEARQRQMVEQAQTARQKYADFDTVLDRLSSLYTAPALDACVHESDLGAELAYYLAQHPDEITRLNQVAQTAPLAMAREVGKLEMRLAPPTNGTTSRSQPPTPKPAPPTPLSGAGNPGTRLIESMSNDEVEAMSQAEFDARYDAQYPPRGRGRR